MSKKAITLPTTPPNPLVSPAIIAGDFIFVAGHCAVPEQGNEVVKGTEAQTRQTLELIKKVLEAAGASLNDVVKTNVYLVNAGDFDEMNRAYKSYFAEDRPARTTVVTSLVKSEYVVEIECVAYYPQRRG